MDTKNILLVGISGKKGHGKDTFAAAITQALEVYGAKVPELRWQTTHFADPLKDEVAGVLSELVRTDIRQGVYPEPTSALAAHVRQEEFDGNVFPGIREALDAPEQKEHYRLFLQWYGTEFRRRQYDDGYWVKQQESQITKWHSWFRPDTPAIVFLPDMRFPNEAEWVRKNNGYLIRVNRVGVPEATDPHPSEVALDDYPHFNLTYTNEPSADWQAKIARDASIALGVMIHWKWSGVL